MSDPLIQQDDAATPLTAEERQGLIPSYITLRGELNQAEQANILEAEYWAYGRRRRGDVLGERFLDNLHQRMLGNVWKWAGTHRQSNKTIGIDAYRIPTELRQLLDDTRYWIDHDSFARDEIAARFHHRLVWIPSLSKRQRSPRSASDRSTTDTAGPASFQLGQRKSRRCRRNPAELRRRVASGRQA